jgi:hypothetical protein
VYPKEELAEMISYLPIDWRRTVLQEWDSQNSSDPRGAVRIRCKHKGNKHKGNKHTGNKHKGNKHKGNKHKGNKRKGNKRKRNNHKRNNHNPAL